MKPMILPTTFCRLLPAACCLVAWLCAPCRSHAWADLFAEGWFVNPLANVTLAGSVSPSAPRSISIWSGGNAGPYPAPGGAVPQASFTAGGIARTVRLSQSAAGQIVAGPLGFPDAASALLATGHEELNRSATYGTLPTLTGAIQLPSGDDGWDIRFPGVLNVMDGIVMGTQQQNYFESRNLEAQRQFEAALRVNPFNTNAAAGILNAIHLRIMPHTFAGNNGLQRADRLRLILPSIPDEVSTITTHAVPHYETAAGHLVAAFERQPVAGLLDGTYRHLALLDGETLVALRGRLLASFGRALALQVEATYRVAKLRSLGEYQNPLGASFNPGPWLDLIEARRRLVYGQLLLGGMFAGVAPDEVLELLQVRQALAALERLGSSLSNGRVSFVGRGSGGSEASFSFREYPPEYVPFFRDESIQALQDSSFDNLKTRALTLAQWSSNRDGEAESVSDNFWLNNYNFEGALEDMRLRSAGELGVLCGLVRDDDENLVPDLLLSLLPPTQRNALYDYAKPGEARGAIYAQYQSIELAQLDIDAALLALQNQISNTQKKQEIGRLIARGQENLAYLILADGSRLASLDKELGEFQALAAKKQGNIHANQGAAVSQGALSGASAGAAAGPWGAAAGAVVGASLSLWGNHDAQKQGKKAGEIQAKLARDSANIQAQRTKILAAQSAKVQFQQRDETLLRTEEAIHALLLEAEQIKLNILINEQRRDMEELELSNMLGRAQFLVQEYIAAIEFAARDPRNSPDFRLIRDLALRDAEETFTHAQEWAYLAAKAAQYRENKPNDNTTAINIYLRQILAARNGTQLKTALEGLDSSVIEFFAQQGFTQLDRAVVSLRHDVFQKNIAVYDGNGHLVPALSSMEAAPQGRTSDQEWRDWLLSSIEYPPSVGPRLVLRFGTSLIRQQGNDLRNINPLYKPLQTHGLIFHRTPDDFGVEVNLRGLGLTGESFVSNPPRVFLRQEGASYIRNLPGRDDLENAGLVVWNLSRTRLGKNASVVPDGIDPIELARIAETSTIVASVNGFKIPGQRGGERLHELSPANDRWVLIIDFDEVANGPLFNQLDRITDIQIRFSIRGL